jgi:hypothetical protein
MMLFIAIITFFLQFQGLDCQVLDVNGVSLDEKVLYIERLMLTPGSIDFQVGPCDFLLNGPPPEESGDLVRLSLFNLEFRARNFFRACKNILRGASRHLKNSHLLKILLKSRLLIYWIDCGGMDKNCFPRFRNCRCSRWQRVGSELLLNDMG